MNRVLSGDAFEARKDWAPQSKRTVCELGHIFVESACRSVKYWLNMEGCITNTMSDQPPKGSSRQINNCVS
jgi:hypothetical protein